MRSSAGAWKQKIPGSFLEGIKPPSKECRGLFLKAYGTCPSRFNPKTANAIGQKGECYSLLRQKSLLAETIIKAGKIENQKKIKGDAQMNSQELTIYFTDQEQKDFVNMSKWFRGMGIGILIIGILAVILPYIATLTVQMMIAVILILSGILHMAHAFTIRKWRNITWEALLAVLFLFTGLLFVAFPMSGAFALTLMLGLFFLILGIIQIQTTLAWRPRPGWGWLLTGGTLSIILGIIVIMGLPGTALWSIGLILGIDLIFSGFTLIMIGNNLKNLSGHLP